MGRGARPVAVGAKLETLLVRELKHRACRPCIEIGQDGACPFEGLLLQLYAICTDFLTKLSVFSPAPGTAVSSKFKRRYAT